MDLPINIIVDGLVTLGALSFFKLSRPFGAKRRLVNIKGQKALIKGKKHSISEFKDQLECKIKEIKESLKDQEQVIEKISKLIDLEQNKTKTFIDYLNNANEAHDYFSKFDYLKQATLIDKNIGVIWYKMAQIIEEFFFEEGEGWWGYNPYAVPDKKGAVIKYLKEAIEKDLKFKETAKTDPVFSKYQNDDEFVKLIQAYDDSPKES